MPFLAHSIAWSALASNLEYRPANSGKPGPQGAHLVFKGAETQPKQLEYFARTLQSTIAEHSRDLRKKLKPADGYKARAATWHSPASAQSNSTGASRSDGHKQEATSTVVQQAQALRDQQFLLSTGWMTPTEIRPVFPSELAIKYDGLRRGEMTDLYEFRNIESWAVIAGPPYDLNEREWTRSRIRSDILKLLIIEAAFREDDAARDRLLDNLLLLLHHPNTDFIRYFYIGLWCCNIGCGIDSLGERALEFFIWIGMLEAMVDRGEKRLLDGIYDEKGSLSHKAYMDVPIPMGLWTEWHEHFAEAVPFRMFMRRDRKFFDSNGTQVNRLNTDIFADQKKLAEMKKWAWKTVLIVDILKRELWADDHRGWEMKILSWVDEVASGDAMGISFTGYEAEVAVKEREESGRLRRQSAVQNG